ncbi:MAG: helix-turn-helix domain-containing protein [Chloroflexi bacterium]|nr:helix-turn-helix domain-containing protein [Chloroflexota bacterium]
MEPGREGRRFLGRREVAARLGVSPQTVTRWAQAGMLPCILTMGGQRRYPEREVEELVGRLWEHARTGGAEVQVPQRRRREATGPHEEDRPLEA